MLSLSSSLAFSIHCRTRGFRLSLAFCSLYLLSILFPLLHFLCLYPTSWRMRRERFIPYKKKLRGQNHGEPIPRKVSRVRAQVHPSTWGYRYYRPIIYVNYPRRRAVIHRGNRTLTVSTCLFLSVITLGTNLNKTNHAIFRNTSRNTFEWLYHRWYREKCRLLVKIIFYCFFAYTYYLFKLLWLIRNILQFVKFISQIYKAVGALMDVEMNYKSLLFIIHTLYYNISQVKSKRLQKTT